MTTGDQRLAYNWLYLRKHTKSLPFSQREEAIDHILCVAQRWRNILYFSFIQQHVSELPEMEFQIVSNSMLA